VRKYAVVGESGKKNQNKTAVMSVMTPVMTMSLSSCQCTGTERVRRGAPLPGHELSGLGMQDTKAYEAEKDDRKAVHQEPITSALVLLCASVEHRRDNHEARGNCAFAHSEDEPHSEQRSERLACGVRKESHPPDKNIHAHPFPNRQLLKCEILGPLECKIAEVEDCPEPIEFGLGKACSWDDTEDCRLAQCGFVCEGH
jgi:hypothetical protein